MWIKKKIIHSFLPYKHWFWCKPVMWLLSFQELIQKGFHETKCCKQKFITHWKFLEILFHLFTNSKFASLFHDLCLFLGTEKLWVQSTIIYYEIINLFFLLLNYCKIITQQIIIWGKFCFLYSETLQEFSYTFIMLSRQKYARYIYKLNNVE